MLLYDPGTMNSEQGCLRAQNPRRGRSVIVSGHVKDSYRYLQDSGREERGKSPLRLKEAV